MNLSIWDFGDFIREKVVFLLIFCRSIFCRHFQFLSIFFSIYWLKLKFLKKGGLQLTSSTSTYALPPLCESPFGSICDSEASLQIQVPRSRRFRGLVLSNLSLFFRFQLRRALPRQRGSTTIVSTCSGFWSTICPHSYAYSHFQPSHYIQPSQYEYFLQPSQYFQSQPTTAPPKSLIPTFLTPTPPEFDRLDSTFESEAFHARLQFTDFFSSETVSTPTTSFLYDVVPVSVFIL